MSEALRLLSPLVAWLSHFLPHASRRATDMLDVVLAATVVLWSAMSGFWPGIVAGVLLLVAVRAGRRG